MPMIFLLLSILFFYISHLSFFYISDMRESLWYLPFWGHLTSLKRKMSIFPIFIGSLCFFWSDSSSFINLYILQINTWDSNNMSPSWQNSPSDLVTTWKVRWLKNVAVGIKCLFPWGIFKSQKVPKWLPENVLIKMNQMNLMKYI